MAAEGSAVWPSFVGRAALDMFTIVSEVTHRIAFATPAGHSKQDVGPEFLVGPVRKRLRPVFIGSVIVATIAAGVGIAHAELTREEATKSPKTTVQNTRDEIVKKNGQGG